MPDEQTFNPEATSDATLLNGTNGDVSQPEAEQQSPPPPEYLSRADFEKWQSENDAKWQARLEQTKRESQAKADKARDTAIRKAKDLDGYVDAMKDAGVELDEAQIASIKHNVINREFWQPEPEPSPTVAPPYQPQPLPADPISQADVVAQLASDQIDVFTIGKPRVDALVKQFANRPKGDPQVVADWNAQLAQIRQEQTQQRQQQQQAQSAAQTANTYGTRPLGGGTASAGYDPVKKLEESNNQDPPDDPVEMQKWLAQRKKWRQEADAKGW
jgi:hypothetical protein